MFDEILEDVPSDAPLDRPEIAKPATGPVSYEQTHVPALAPRDAADHEPGLVSHLDLPPACARPVRGQFILGNKALIPALFHQLPGLKTIVRKAASRQDR